MRSQKFVESKLRSRIVSDFESTRYPSPGCSLIETTDDEGLGEFFYDRRNRDNLPASDLASRYHVLWFFTIDAFYYYLPAFMIAALDGQEVLWGALIEQFAGRIDPGRTQQLIAGLTPSQRCCVRDFFEHYWLLITPPDVEADSDVAYSQVLQNLSL